MLPNHILKCLQNAQTDCRSSFITTETGNRAKFYIIIVIKNDLRTIMVTTVTIHNQPLMCQALVFFL